MKLMTSISKIKSIFNKHKNYSKTGYFFVCYEYLGECILDVTDKPIPYKSNPIFCIPLGTKPVFCCTYFATQICKALGQPNELKKAVSNLIGYNNLSDYEKFT